MVKGLLLDFDCTITEKHFYAAVRGKSLDKALSAGRELISEEDYMEIVGLERIESEIKLKNQREFINFIFGGEERIECLEKFFKKVIATGVRISIATRGNAQEVVWLMQAVNLDKYIDYIHGRHWMMGAIHNVHQAAPAYGIRHATWVPELFKRSNIVWNYIKCDTLQTKGDFAEYWREKGIGYMIYLDDHPEWNVIQHPFVGSFHSQCPVKEGITEEHMELVSEELGCVS